MSGFNGFNYHVKLFKVFTNKAMDTSNMGNAAKVKYNSVVRMFRNEYGMSLDDVRDLLTYAFYVSECPSSECADIRKIFQTYGREFNKWKEEYHYELKERSVARLLWETRPLGEDDDMYDEIKEAFCL